MDGWLRHVLNGLGQELARLYGKRLRHVYLYGSRARGDATEDSDVDVAVILEGEVAPEREIRRVSESVCELSLRHDTVIACVFLSRERFERGEGPLVRSVRAEGVSF